MSIRPDPVPLRLTARLYGPGLRGRIGGTFAIFLAVAAVLAMLQDVAIRYHLTNVPEYLFWSILGPLLLGSWTRYYLSFKTRWSPAATLWRTMPLLFRRFSRAHGRLLLTIALVHGLALAAGVGLGRVLEGRGLMPLTDLAAVAVDGVIASVTMGLLASAALIFESAVAPMWGLSAYLFFPAFILTAFGSGTIFNLAFRVPESLIQRDFGGRGLLPDLFVQIHQGLLGFLWPVPLISGYSFEAGFGQLGIGWGPLVVRLAIGFAIVGGVFSLFGTWELMAPADAIFERIGLLIKRHWKGFLAIATGVIGAFLLWLVGFEGLLTVLQNLPGKLSFPEWPFIGKVFLWAAALAFIYFEYPLLVMVLFSGAGKKNRIRPYFPEHPTGVKRLLALGGWPEGAHRDISALAALVWLALWSGVLQDSEPGRWALYGIPSCWLAWKVFLYALGALKGHRYALRELHSLRKELKLNILVTLGFSAGFLDQAEHTKRRLRCVEYLPLKPSQMFRILGTMRLFVLGPVWAFPLMVLMMFSVLLITKEKILFYGWMMFSLSITVLIGFVTLLFAYEFASTTRVSWRYKEQVWHRRHSQKFWIVIGVIIFTPAAMGLAAYKGAFGLTPEAGDLWMIRAMKCWALLVALGLIRAFMESLSVWWRLRGHRYDIAPLASSRKLKEIEAAHTAAAQVRPLSEPAV